MKLGSWQMVLWQPRWVFAELDGLCYQKISADEVRSGALRAGASGWGAEETFPLPARCARPQLSVCASLAQKPIGQPKKILFSSMLQIEELDCGEVRRRSPLRCCDPL